MPRNGSGVYNLPSGINPVVTQTLITSNWANTTMTDIANALTGSVSRDGQSPMTGNLNMANFQVTNLGTPTTQNAAVSLGMVQAGTQWRLTNVGGSANQITAALPGNIQSVALGQFVELIPAVNNTGAVQININGIGFQNITTQLGNPLAANNLQAGKPYILLWDGNEWLLCFSPNANAFAQSAISGWDRPSNGQYPLVTKVDNSTISVPAGKGRIVAPGTRDQSGLTEVSWVLQNISLTGMGNAWCTTIAVNAAGNIVQLAGPLQASWARQYIILATVGHVDGKIESIVQQPSIYGDMAYEAYDLGNMFQNTIMSGGQLTTSANPMHLEVHAGRMWLMGGNANNANQPNFVDFADQLDITVWPVTANNTVGAPVQTIPVTQYDPAGAGALANIPDPATSCVIHRVFLMAGQYIFVYGQTVYGGLATAIQNLNLDNGSFKPPGKLQGATLFGYVIAQKNCANLGDGATGQIIGPNAAAAGGGGGGGVTEAPLSGLGYARRNAAWNEAPYYDVNGGVSIGHNTDGFPVNLRINAQPGYFRNLVWQSSGVNRWAWVGTNEAEAGANAGTNFNLSAFDDNGAFLFNPIRFNRANGQTFFDPGAVTIGSPTLASAARVWMSAAAGQQKKTQYQTAGNARWEWGTDLDAESGGDAGSSMFLQSFTDAGAIRQRILTFARNAVTMMLGNNTAPGGVALQINGAAQVGRQIQFMTAGNIRWTFGAEATPESGGNAGTNLIINRYNDAGVFLDQPFVMLRQTAQATLATNGQQYTLAIKDQGANGAGLLFIGSGATTPNKTIRANNGRLEFTNSAYSAVVSYMDDAGNWGINGSLTATQNVIGNIVQGAAVKCINSGAESDMTFGYNGSANSGNYFAITNSAFALNYLNASSGYGGNAFNWFRGGYWNFAGNVYPSVDNAQLLGSASNRWSQVWAVNGTIQTSDMRTKKEITENPLGLDFVNSISIKHFKLIEGQKKVEMIEPPEKLDAEGEVIPQDSVEKITVIPGVRTHIGPLAQDIVEAFKKAGHDPGDMAAWCLLDPADPDSLQQIRPDELLWTLWTAVQELSAQVQALSAKRP